MNQKQTNKVYELIQQLIRNFGKFSVASINASVSGSPSHVVNQATDFVLNHLNERKTVFKRSKHIQSNELFVAPKEIAIGTRWERTKIKRNGRIRTIAKLIQSTFQYVLILKTLESLFKREQFSDLYFAHNSTVTHNCDDGSYIDFCCGETFKRNSFFKDNPHCVKIQLYSDEFELCNPLQSKSGVHKVCAVYFTIRNTLLQNCRHRGYVGPIGASALVFSSQLDKNGTTTLAV